MCRRIVYQQGDVTTPLGAILRLDAAGVSASISQLYCRELHPAKQQTYLNHFMHFGRETKNYGLQRTILM
jgi:hypothetical protein